MRCQSPSCLSAERKRIYVRLQGQPAPTAMMQRAPGRPVEGTVSKIVTTHYRYKRPTPRKRAKVESEPPTIVTPRNVPAKQRPDEVEVPQTPPPPAMASS